MGRALGGVLWWESAWRPLDRPQRALLPPTCAGTPSRAFTLRPAVLQDLLAETTFYFSLPFLFCWGINARFLGAWTSHFQRQLCLSCHNSACWKSQVRRPCDHTPKEHLLQTNPEGTIITLMASHPRVKRKWLFSLLVWIIFRFWMKNVIRTGTRQSSMGKTASSPRTT